MKDDVTVITPTIPPRAKMMLPRALASVARQTHPAAALAVAVDTNREGAPATRQRALLMARTTWVAPLDDDDEFMPFHLHDLLAHARETDADFVYSWFRVKTPEGRVFAEDPVFPETHFTNPFDPANPIETTITVLVKRELALDVGYRALDRGEKNTGEDYNFLLGCVAAGAKISHLVKHTWFWNHHSHHTSGRPVGW
jgi:glycosyltransferase involved in cell wall biosynthesis